MKILIVIPHIGNCSTNETQPLILTSVNKYSAVYFIIKCALCENVLVYGFWCDQRKYENGKKKKMASIITDLMWATERQISGQSYINSPGLLYMVALALQSK